MRVRRSSISVLCLLGAGELASAFVATHSGCSATAVAARAPASCARGSRCVLRGGGDMEEERRRLQIRQLEECLNIATLESAAEEAEARGDLVGAIDAYEELLSLQPPTSPGLREQDAVRRGLQQLLLESARRRLEACQAESGECEVEVSFIEGELQRAQKLGEESRKQLASRALADLGKVRDSVVRLLELTETQAREDADKAQGEQAEQRLLDGDPGWLAGLQLAEATRRMDDARLLRKSVEADLNRLELQLLQGDPSLAWIRKVLKTTRNQPLPEEEISLWLKEQCEGGALPRDPELLRALLEQARNDPEMVVRLVTGAKDRAGKDIFTRRENDKGTYMW